MKRTTCQWIGLLLIPFVAAACSSGAKIVANSDPMADFGRFETYDFYEPLSSDRGETRSIISNHFIAAASRELEARGLKRASGNADLLVDFGVSTQEKIRVSNQPTTSMTMHRGRGRAGTWSGYSVGMSTQQVTQTTEGTAAIDVVDRKNNQLVWEAAATGRVTDSTRQNIGPVIQQAVADMFAKFPVQPKMPQM